VRLAVWPKNTALLKYYRKTDMAFTEYELVVLDDGEIALQRSGSDEPLVRISFSPSVLAYLDGKHVDVAKSMMDAGIQTVFEINDDRAPAGPEHESKRQTLH
jgi:hypothetical protein|tara:strand:- start:12687 stop:12992 length:306 start_codon:yes stop_codon:yes gene_type:complete